ncbi:hypothetical protein QE431_002246 [Flavobacterium sp. SORGH_AS 622]|nr:hypothetical protein [Flavobacterium sp. SORGH_AS_0622]
MPNNFLMEMSGLALRVELFLRVPIITGTLKTLVYYYNSIDSPICKSIKSLPLSKNLRIDSS